jgi:hypothetical protein
MMSVQPLLEKLPLAVDWIDHTLAAHAREARPVASLGFKRLPGFYSSRFLEQAKVVAVDRVPVPPLEELYLHDVGASWCDDCAGITFKDTYFVKAEYVDNESLHFHELVHAVQWEYLGVEKFLLTYAEGLATKGYLGSPLEAMAYELQDYFDWGGKPCDVEAIVRQALVHTGNSSRPAESAGTGLEYR